MITVTLLAAYVLLILYQLYKYCTYRPPNFPPGPPRIPIFGSYLFLLLLDHRHLHKAALRLCGWYKSKVIGFYVGNTPTVVANDLASVREVLFNPAYDGRPDIFLARMRDPDHEQRGIFFVDGPKWKEQRWFTLRHLRDFGFGRRFEQLEHDTREEILSFMDILRSGPKFEHEKVFKDHFLENISPKFPLLEIFQSRWFSKLAKSDLSLFGQLLSPGSFQRTDPTTRSSGLI